VAARLIEVGAHAIEGAQAVRPHFIVAGRRRRRSSRRS
jgi:hypothetical protein